MMTSCPGTGPFSLYSMQARIGERDANAAETEWADAEVF